jgi:hypothetical protein
MGHDDRRIGKIDGDVVNVNQFPYFNRIPPPPGIRANTVAGMNVTGRRSSTAS